MLAVWHLHLLLTASCPWLSPSSDHHDCGPQHAMSVAGLLWQVRLPGTRSGDHLAGICRKPQRDSTAPTGAVQLALPLYSFDVEYAHYRQGGTQVRVPAEVAVVDASMQVMMASYCAPGE